MYSRVHIGLHVTIVTTCKQFIHHIFEYYMDDLPSITAVLLTFKRGP